MKEYTMNQNEYSFVESRILLDECGAEGLLMLGDMLYKPVGYKRPKRIQAGFIGTKEIGNVTAYVKSNSPANYNNAAVRGIEALSEQLDKTDNSTFGESIAEADRHDKLLNLAVTVVLSTGNASTAFLQRKLRIGFPRSAMLIDEMEEMGIIGPQEGASPRRINITLTEWCERLGLV